FRNIDYKMADEGSVTPKVELKTLSLLRVVDLKSELDQRGLSKSGSKKDLIDRLKVRLQLENIQAESAASCVEGQVPNMSLQDDETGQNIFVKQYLADQQRTYEKEKEARKNIDKEREDSSSQEIEESMSEEDLSSRNMCKQNTISSGEKEISADLESVGRLRRSSRKPRTPVSENTEVEENADGDGKTQVEETGTEETEEEMSLIQSSLESNGDADTKIKGGNVRLILEKVDVTVANETLKHEIQKQSEDKGSGKLDVVCDPEDDLNLGMKGSSGENTSSVDRKINASERKSAESEVGKSKEGRRRRWDNKRVSEDKSDINDQTKDNKIKLKRRTSNQGSDQAGEADRDEKYKSNEGDVTVDDADKIKRSTRNDRVGLEKANRRSSVANVEEKRDDKLKKPDAVEKKEDEISGDLVNSKKLSSETGKDSADRKSTLTKKSQEGDVRSVVKNTNDEVNVERKSRSRQRRKEKRSESESSSSDGSRSSSSGSSSGSSRASKNSSRSNSASSSSSGSTSSSSGSSSSSTSQSSKSAAEDETSTKVSKPKDSSNKLHSKRNTSAAELRKETSEPSKLEDGAKADDSNKKEKNAKKRTSSPDDGRKSRRKRSTSPGDGKKTIDKKSAVAGDVSIRSSKTSPAPGDKRKSRTKRSPSAEKKKKRDSKKRSETPERRGGRSQKRSKSPD
ncbi:ACIN1 (predicted), partial [Pycnogonum litorale]